MEERERSERPRRTMTDTVQSKAAPTLVLALLAVTGATTAETMGNGSISADLSTSRVSEAEILLSIDSVSTFISLVIWIVANFCHCESFDPTPLSRTGLNRTNHKFVMLSIIPETQVESESNESRISGPDTLHVLGRRRRGRDIAITRGLSLDAAGGGIATCVASEAVSR